MQSAFIQSDFMLGKMLPLIIIQVANEART